MVSLSNCKWIWKIFALQSWQHWIIYSELYKSVIGHYFINNDSEKTVIYNARHGEEIHILMVLYNVWRTNRYKTLVQSGVSSLLFAESKMLCQQPIITHTVATPQDSPNTTLDSSVRDFNNRLMAPAFYASSTSIDSIDRSLVSKALVSLSLMNPFENNIYVVMK